METLGDLSTDPQKDSIIGMEKIIHFAWGDSLVGTEFNALRLQNKREVAIQYRTRQTK